MCRFAILMLFVLLAATAPPEPARAQQLRVGVATTVNDSTGAQEAAGSRRPLIGGGDIFSRDTIVTDASGQAQLLFLDQSALTVGPNAEVLIDEFVYNPQENSDLGRLAISVNQGVMRFVGGTLSKTEDQVEITTPTATLAIRGAIVVLLVDGNSGDTQVVFVFGDYVDVTGPNGESETIRRRGYMVSVSAQGVSEPVPAPQDLIDAIHSALEGPQGGSGDPRIQAIQNALDRQGLDGVILSFDGELIDLGSMTITEIESELGLTDADQEIIRDIIESTEIPVELPEDEGSYGECWECSTE